MSIEVPHCQVCYADLKHPGVTPCGHNEVCGTCHLRLRHLHSDKKCPMCKQENQQVIVDRFEDMKTFDEYPLWGDELGSGFTFRDDVGMFFPTKYYENEVLSLFGHHCGVCYNYDGITPDVNIYDEADKRKQQQGKKSKGPATAIRGLQDHLRNKHRVTLCELCVDNKRDFVARLPRFSPSQLKTHMSKGDGNDSGFRGHPVCEFCRPKRFYDLTFLHMHLQKDHYKCHVCEKQGLANQYFRDYRALEKHFDLKHFLCKDVQCIAARFMVFENDIDMRAHELSVHGGTSTGSTKIQLEFRVRREGYSGAGYENQTAPSDADFQYGVGGEAFVPEGLPQRENGPNQETSHPLHFQRTAELREQAAEIRANQDLNTGSGSADDAFPSLSDANQAESIRMGWIASGSLQRISRNGVTTNSAEQFPSLSAAPVANNSVAAKLRAGGVSGNRQFSAMRSAAMGNASAPSTADWGSQGAARPAAGTSAQTSFIAPSAAEQFNRQSDLGADNFPSLDGASKTRSAYPATSSYSGTNRSVAASHAPSISANNFPSMSANNFPSMGNASKTRASYPVIANRSSAQAPSMNNTSHFPPPPTTTARTSAVREKLLGNRKPAPANNLANFPTPSTRKSLQQGQTTVEEMKGSLGLAKYKDLKNLTKEFAHDNLAPQAYVDHAAALFESGYGDADFWSFVPALLMSCPNQTSSAAALRYMEELRAALRARATPAPDISWSASPALPAPSRSTAPTPYYGSAAARAPQAAHRRVGVATQPVSSRSGLNVGQGQKKSSWGGTGGASTAVRAKASPLSVSAAAANQNPQSGTATKFMAKEKKQQNHQANSSGTGKTKKKKKEANELRALAFGK